jgi:hypothetical protein
VHLFVADLSGLVHHHHRARRHLLPRQKFRNGLGIVKTLFQIQRLLALRCDDKAVNPNGRIELKDGRILPENYREFVRGYAITSYGSQGKTVEHVLFSDSTIKAATNNQQWLVTISRGTRAVKIFTPSKEQLRENVSRLGDRELAIEFSKQNSKQRMPVPIRKYINGLIESRRPQATQTPIEKIDLWKPNLTPRQTQRMSARRI